MIDVFGTSRINLNLSNASVTSDGRSSAPAGRVERLRQLLTPRRAVAASADDTYEDQIKGRNFEIPGTGGFQLSGSSEDLASYYEPDKEIVLFSSTDELIDKARHFLQADAERSAIAKAGYQRTVAEHTYAHRYRGIFRELELL
jgi:spore maturation protein CgeB